jgi:hypothetical protein
MKLKIKNDDNVYNDAAVVLMPVFGQVKGISEYYSKLQNIRI